MMLKSKSYLNCENSYGPISAAFGLIVMQAWITSLHYFISQVGAPEYCKHRKAKGRCLFLWESFKYVTRRISQDSRPQSLRSRTEGFFGLKYDISILFFAELLVCWSKV